jgi:hypothetical protein
MKVPEEFRWRNHPIPAFRSDSSSGNNGAFLIPHYRINGHEFMVLASDGSHKGAEMIPWEHVSVTVRPIKKNATRCPTWEEMCYIKNLFWGPKEVVIEFHPAEEDYVSQHEFCLHLWRHTKIEIPIPPSIAVGIKQR